MKSFGFLSIPACSIQKRMAREWGMIERCSHLSSMSRAHISLHYPTFWGYYMVLQIHHMVVHHTYSFVWSFLNAGFFQSFCQQISEHLIPSLSGDTKYQNASISLVSNDGCKVLQNNKNYSSPFLDRTRYSSSPTAECTVTSIAPYHREVITVRTPLPHNDQESCV